MTHAVALESVRCLYGAVKAVDGVDLAIAQGEFFTLLGPSGSGKTTCLRVIGGFTLPNAGRVLIEGRDLTQAPPYARPVNTVFQDYALFPHMNVRDNVAYGLMVRGAAKPERHRRAEQMLELVRLPTPLFAAAVQRLVAEDPDTEQHFAKYFGELLSLKLRSRLRSQALVEDARQETFKRVLTTLKEKGGLASAESLGAFVNGVCNNVLFEFYRAGSRVQPLAEDHDEADHGNPGAEAGLMAADERGRVARALAGLPQKDKDILRWLFFEERDKDEICRALNVDRDYLRVLVHRAKAQFRKRYEEGSD